MSELDRLHQEKKKLDQVSPSFCLAKWQQVSLHLHNGNTQSCHHVSGHVVKPEALGNPAALHNTPEKKFARAQMLKGERPSECEYCWKLEDKGALSDRVIKSSDPWASLYFAQVLRDGSQGDTIPSYLEIAFDSACQFKCMYCSPVFSTKWEKEIEEFGHYPTSERFNSFERYRREGTLPKSPEERARYIDAFWKWWPELAPKLMDLRITGGEPFLSRETFRLIDELVANPQKHLLFSINTNMGFNSTQLGAFLERVEALRNSVKKVKLFTSIDTVGAQAEYIRFGLNYRSFVENIETILSEVKGPIDLIFMVTVNNLCLPGFKDLMKLIRDLRLKYPQHEIRVDTPYLRNPPCMSVELLPPSFVSYVDRAIEYMRENSGLENEAPFPEIEIEKVSRIRLLMLKSSMGPERKRILGADFYRMFSEYDKRRGTNFLETFPEYKEFWENCEFRALISPDEQVKKLTFTQMNPPLLERLKILIPELNRMRIGMVQLPYYFLKTAGALLEDLRFENILVGCEISLEEFIKIGAGAIAQKFPEIDNVSLRLDQPDVQWPETLSCEPSEIEVKRILITLQGPWLHFESWKCFLQNAPMWVRSRIEVLTIKDERNQSSSPSVMKVYDLLLSLRKEFPAVNIKGVRQDEDANLLLGEVDVFPTSRPLIAKKKSERNPLISVIIPTFNQGQFLLRQLSILSQQIMDLKDFEVIVIDDGSADGTEDLLRSFSAGAGEGFQLTYIFNPRPRKWSNSLPLHRAGIARNVGAEYAQGKKLLFLDSDILFDRDFLKKMWKAANEFDVIQCPRLHVSPQESQDLFRVDQQKPVKTYIEDESYWKPFFETKNWSSLDFFWKYTCTYCLCVDRRLFWKMGGFDRSILTYGFEDTQFGYQAYWEKASFHLLKNPVYHLTDENHDFRFGLFAIKRYWALAKSAKHFYLNYLDAEIFWHFYPFMRTSLTQKFFLRYLSRSVSASR